jgi:hypothetical protein
LDGLKYKIWVHPFEPSLAKNIKKESFTLNGTKCFVNFYKKDAKNYYKKKFIVFVKVHKALCSI